MSSGFLCCGSADYYELGGTNGNLELLPDESGESARAVAVLSGLPPPKNYQFYCIRVKSNAVRLGQCHNRDNKNAIGSIWDETASF